jgi:hypothetical protein
LEIEPLRHENSIDDGSIAEVHEGIKYNVRAHMDINLLHRTVTVLGHGGLGLALEKTLIDLKEWSEQGGLESIFLIARDKFDDDLH